MLTVNNTNKLKDLMEFKDGTYYKFVCLLRTKDYKDSNEEPMLKCMEKQEILVKDWLIDDQEMLDKTLPDMLKFTEMFRCRLYMCTDRKSIIKTLKTMRDTVQNYLDPFLGNSNADCSVRAIKKICSSATNKSESSDKEGRKWLFDVDTKDLDIVQRVIRNQGKAKCVCLETRNGYHIVANKTYDAHAQVLPKSVELKDNAMVLIAMG